MRRLKGDHKRSDKDAQNQAAAAGAGEMRFQAGAGSGDGRAVAAVCGGVGVGDADTDPQAVPGCTTGAKSPGCVFGGVDDARAVTGRLAVVAGQLRVGHSVRLPASANSRHQSTT